jgi:hypothetical protein
MFLVHNLACLSEDIHLSRNSGECGAKHLSTVKIQLCSNAVTQGRQLADTFRIPGGDMKTKTMIDVMLAATMFINCAILSFILVLFTAGR